DQLTLIHFGTRLEEQLRNPATFERRERGDFFVPNMDKVDEKTMRQCLPNFMKLIDNFLAPPTNAQAYLDRGAAYARKDDNDRAIADFNRAIQLDPKNAQAYIQRGGTYSVKGDEDRAIADYNQAIKLDPQNARAYVALGTSYGSRGDTDRAIAAFNKAMQ